MNKKTDLVFEYFEKKYGFDIQKLGIDKYQINHYFQTNNKYFDNKDSIKLMILQIEKMIDQQIKENKKKIINNSFLEKEKPKEIVIEKKKPIIKKSSKIYIDSKDRNFREYKFPSYFTFELDTFVKEVTIKELILKTTTKEKDSSDNLENIPYLILDLASEKKQGSNKFLQSSSCILTNHDIRGEYRYYTINDTILFPRKVNKISLRIKKPDGDMYNFGTNNNDYIRTVVLLHLEYFLN